MTTNNMNTNKYIKTNENCNKERLLEIDYILKAMEAYYKQDMKELRKAVSFRDLKNILINEQKEILKSSGGSLEVEYGKFVLINNKVEIE